MDLIDIEGNSGVVARVGAVRTACDLGDVKFVGLGQLQHAFEHGHVAVNGSAGRRRSLNPVMKRSIMLIWSSKAGCVMA